MATFYVDFVNGNDANNGLGPDASHATNKPWKTVGKAVGAAGMASGDTAYFAPGSFREVITLTLTPAAETLLIGDPQNLQGFKTAAGVLVPPGPVIWTAFTTNDKTAPSGSTLITMNGKSFYTFRNLMFVGGTNTNGIFSAAASSTNITFTDCIFHNISTSGGNCGTCTSAFSVVLHWLFDRCIFSISGGVVFAPATGVGADWDLDVVFRNCWRNGFQSSAWITLTASGASANKPGGIIIRNCSQMGAGAMLQVSNANGSTTIPCQVLNSLIFASAVTALNANALGQITENYNLIVNAGTPRTNVAVGANSISNGSYAPLVSFGYEMKWGSRLRFPGAPMPGSPILGFGNDGSAPAVDVTNRPRPAGGNSALTAVGANERGNTFTKETTTVYSGTSAISFTGPAYQDFEIPVVANVLATLSVRCRRDGTYAGTNPGMYIVNGEGCGVADTSVTDAGGANAWNLITLSFTPTSDGIVTVRLRSLDTNGGGGAFFDAFQVG
jgi:hypothetical protein